MLITYPFVDNFRGKNMNLVQFFLVMSRKNCIFATRIMAHDAYSLKENHITVSVYMDKIPQSFSRLEASGYGQFPLDDDRPAILVTNDDGYDAGGIKALVESLRGLGRIIVCAPDSPRSGYSASFTCMRPINLLSLSDDGEVAVFACNGTPVDCVKIALHRLFHVRKPDLILSGINHGGNDSVSVMYSGTMGAVLEGCAVGISSIGFSLLNLSPMADFTNVLPITRSISEQVLANPMPRGVVLNVNIPDVVEPKGIRVCRQSDGYWESEYHYLEGDEKTDMAWFQVTGTYINNEPEATDTDRYWLDREFVSVVPTTIDQTAYRHFGQFDYLEK